MPQLRVHERLQLEAGEPQEPSVFDGLLATAKVAPCGGFLDDLLAPTRGARRVRALVDHWVDALPPEARHELVARLRDQNSEGPRSAFNELVVGQALHTIGPTRYAPTDLPCAGVPDWVVRLPGRDVVVEVLTLEEPQSPDEKKRKAILCRVAEIIGPWSVLIDWRRSPGIEAAAPWKVKRAVSGALAELAAPSARDLVLNVDGIPITIAVHHRVDANSSVVAVDSTRSIRINPGEESMKDRVSQKGRKYRGLKAAGIPLVVCVCTDDILVDKDNVSRALYGREQISVSWDPGAAEPVALDSGVDLSGLFTPQPGGVRNTTISEVWLVKREAIRKRLALRIVRAPNPWAQNPIDWRPRRMSAFRFRHLRASTRIQRPGRTVRLPLDPPLTPSRVDS